MKPFVFIILVYLSFLFQNVFAQFSGLEQFKIDSLNQVIKESTYDTSIVNAYIELGEIMSVSNIDTILQFSEKAKTIIDKNLIRKGLHPQEELSFKKSLADFKNQKGYVLRHKGNVVEALGYYTESLEISKAIADRRGVARSLNNIGFLHLFLDSDLNLAKEYLLESLEIWKALENKKGISGVLNNLGAISYKQEDTVQAMELYKESLAIIEEIGDKDGMGIPLNNIAVYYVEQKAYTEALKYLDKSAEIAKEIGDKEGIIRAAINIGNICLRRKEYFQAEKYGKESLELSQQQGFPHMIQDAAKLLSFVYEETNEPVKELLHYKIHIKARDSVRSIGVEREITKRIEQYKYEKEQAIMKMEHQKEVAISRERNNKQRAYLFFTIIFALMLLLLGVLIIRDQKHKHALSEQKLTSKSKELTSYTIRLAQNDQFLSELDKLMDEIVNEKSKKDITNSIHDLKKKIKQNKGEEKYLTEFQKQFEGVHKDFVGNLKVSYPNLTPNELRICTLIKMNMSTHDMSALLGVAKGSIIQYRHRIHKKMELPSKTKLSDFILKFG